MSISRSIVRPLQKSVSRSVAQGAVTDPLQEIIQQLFGNGEQGAFYLPQPVVNGQQVLFQDAAGTIPVTADGDPVGLMKDLSGLNRDASQSVAEDMVVYSPNEVSFDGVSDYMEFSEFSTTGEFTISFAVTFQNVTQTGMFIGVDDLDRTSAKVGVVDSSVFARLVTGGESITSPVTSSGVPHTITIVRNSTGMTSLRVDGQQVSSTLAEGSARFNQFCGSNGTFLQSQFFFGKLHGAVMVASDTGVDVVEAFLSTTYGN